MSQNQLILQLIAMSSDYGRLCFATAFILIDCFLKEDARADSVTNWTMMLIAMCRRHRMWGNPTSANAAAALSATLFACAAADHQELMV